MRPSPAHSPLTGIRVLVVEDEYFIADDIERALVALGAIVVGPAPSLEHASELLAGAPTDLAVLDINLRGEMVFPIVQVLRDRGVPFVFATGYGEKSIPSGYEDVPGGRSPPTSTLSPACCRLCCRNPVHPIRARRLFFRSLRLSPDRGTAFATVLE